MYLTQGNTQVYSPFGSYVVEQHGADCLRRYIDDLPRPDLTVGEDHPLAQSSHKQRRAAGAIPGAVLLAPRISRT